MGLDLKSPLRMERRWKSPLVHFFSFFFLWFWGFSLLFVVVGTTLPMKSLLFCVFCGVFLGCVLSDRRIERKCTVIFYCLSGTLCSA